MILLVALLFILVLSTTGLHAFEEETPNGCQKEVGLHPGGAWARCDVAGREVIVIAGNHQSVECHQGHDTVIIITGDHNKVECTKEAAR